MHKLFKILYKIALYIKYIWNINAFLCLNLVPAPSMALLYVYKYPKVQSISESETKNFYMVHSIYVEHFQ